MAGCDEAGLGKERHALWHAMAWRALARLDMAERGKVRCGEARLDMIGTRHGMARQGLAGFVKASHASCG